MGKDGFTLIETVMTVAIGAVIGLCLTGFISSQLKLYVRCDETLRAKIICSRACGQLERELRYAYVYYTDPEDSGSLCYYVRPEKEREARDRFGRLKLPPPSAWPSLSEADLAGLNRDGMQLKLDFKASEPEEAHICLWVVAPDGEKEERLLYRQDMVVPSLYRREIRKEAADEQN